MLSEGGLCAAPYVRFRSIAKWLRGKKMARVVVTRDDQIAKAIADVFRHIDLEPLVRDRVV
jgi:hypothetical protein